MRDRERRLDVVADRQTWHLAVLVQDRCGENAFEAAVSLARTAMKTRDSVRFEIWAEVAVLIREMRRPLRLGEALN